MLSRWTPVAVRALFGVALACAVATAAQAQSGVFAPIPTISPTTTLSAGHVCATDGRDIYCDGTLPLTSGLGASDRIISGSQAMIINTSSGGVSLTTAGTQWGYLLPSGFSYLPFLNTLGVSATGTVSATNGYFVGNVGVGLSATGRLTVQSSGTSTDLINGYNTLGNKIFQIYETSGKNGLFNLSNSLGTTQFNITTGTGGVSYLSNAGTFGFNTKTPSNTLDVSGTIKMADDGTACNATTNIVGAMRYASGQFYVCRNAATGWEVLTAGAASVSTALGDRITSGTQAAIINSSTGVVSLSTAGTDWGYLAPTGFSYLPYLNTLGVSATGTVSATNGYFATNVGIGRVANSGYGEDISGSVRISQNTGSTGIIINNNGVGGLIYTQNTGGSLFIQSTAAGNNTYIGTGGGLVGIGTNSPVTTFGVSGTSSFMNGNMGIGTTAGASSLTIIGEAQVSSSGVGCATANAGAIRYASASLSYCNGTAWTSLSSNTTAALADRITSGTDAVLVNGTSHTVSFTTNGVVAGYIDAIGNHVVPGVSATGTVSATNGYFAGLVGIGRAATQFPLEVSGTINVNNTGTSNGLRIARTGQAQAYLFSTASDNTYLRNYNGSLYLDTESNAPIIFLTSASEAMRLTANNRLGLSTATPNTTLDVSGTIRMAYGNETCSTSTLGSIQFNAVSATFSVCRNTTAGWETLTAGTASASTALSDRIVSGTAAAIINSATGVVSLSMAGTDWGYLHPTSFSYLPSLNTLGVSVTGVITASSVYAGSVGVGTAYPSATLHVYSGGSPAMQISRIGNVNSVLAFSNPSYTVYTGLATGGISLWQGRTTWS